jgi:hypothetical protein
MLTFSLASSRFRAFEKLSSLWGRRPAGLRRNAAETGGFWLRQYAGQETDATNFSQAPSGERDFFYLLATVLARVSAPAMTPAASAAEP